VTTTVEQIDSWRSAPSETEILEFKEAKLQFNTETLYGYCVAIANEGGGTLLLGVSDKPPRSVVGTLAFANPAKTANQILQHVKFRVDIDEVHHPNGRVLAFHIPSRLKGSAYSLRGAFLMRSGESLVPMSEDRLRAIFAENENWLEDSSKTGLDAQQVVELLDTQTLFELLHLPYPTNRDGVIERLTELRFIDRVGEHYSIRRLGAILIAKRLDQFPELVRKAPRVVTYTGPSKAETAADFPGNKGYAVGFQGLVKFVCNLLPQNEVIQDALRTSTRLVPDTVIRELLANALIHQNFEIGGVSMMVDIYSNRIEISNPGEPLVPVERFIDGCRSRNERFASLMRKLGVCEEKGSGIDTVIRTAELLQLPAPDFRTGFQTTNVVIYGSRPFAEMTRDDRIRACYQHCTLKYVMSERMTNRSLRERFKLAEGKSATVSQIIAQTEAIGLIKEDKNIGGSRKYARYLPIWA
jgi:predicted HTH transcriptional regulator